MNIGLDASLAVGQKAGVGYYVSNLIDALAKIDTENAYLLYPFFGITFHDDLKSLRAPSSNFKVYMGSKSKRLIKRERNRLGIDDPAYFNGIDLLHSTTFFIPKNCQGKIISTIYDLSFILFPECHTEANRLYCLQGTIDAVLRCERLIAISENTKNDLIKYFNVEPDRIVVTHLAPATIFEPNKDKAKQVSVLKKHGIRKPYIFSLGSIEPRKNLIRLIEAYSQLELSLRKDLELVIGGASGWLNSNIYAEVKAQKLEDKVKFLGFVADEDLPVLYSASSMFVYPSLYEGFGLPVVEAMACGTPVITSNNSSLKEIAEGAALLIDPLDIFSIAKAINSVLSDSQLSTKMKTGGIARAAKFTWQRAAEKTLAVYKSLN